MTCIGVKLIFDGQMRRFPFQGQSFDSLKEQIITLLGLEKTVDLVLKYTDEEGDLITISSDLELKSAIVSERLLRLAVSLRTPVVPLIPATPVAMDVDLTDAKFVDPKRSQLSEEEWAVLKQHKKEFKKQFKHHEKKWGHGGFHQPPPSFSPFGGHPHHPFGGPHQPHGPDGCHPAPAPFGGHHGSEGHQHPSRGFAPCGRGGHGRGHWRGHYGGHHGGHHSPHEGPRYKHPHCGKEGKEERYVARYAQDITILDGSEIAPNTPFVKTWRLRNEGTTAWPVGSMLRFVGKHSDDLGGPEFVAVESAVPGQDIDISVNLCSPNKPGRYTGYWRMCTPDDKKFGQRVWVSIVVPGVASSSEEDKEADRIDALVDVVLADEQLRSYGVKRHRVFRLLQKCDGNSDQVVALIKSKLSKKCQKHEEKQQKCDEKMAKKYQKAEEKQRKCEEKKAKKQSE